MKLSKLYDVPMLSLTLCVILCSPSWSDQNASTQPAYELDEVVITATRMEIPKQHASANITVISLSDIEKMPVSNAAEILQYMSGLYVEITGGLGSSAVASIQGSEVRHVTVYQDGVPLNQLANPVTDLSFLPVDVIDRIEVHKGAASSAWGSALGGVINIITREPDEDRTFGANIRTSYGEDETLKSRGSFSGTIDRFGYFISLTHDQSDGFIAHTAYKQDAVYGKINYKPGDRSQLSFVYSYDEGRIEEPLTNFFPEIEVFWDDDYRKRTYQRLLFETWLVEDLLFTIEGRYHRFYNFIEDVFVDRRETFNDYWDHSYGISTRLNWEMNDVHAFTLGFDEDWGRYSWYSWQFYTTGIYKTRNAAVYINDTFTYGPFSLNAGLRHDDNRDFGGSTSPSVGLVYRFAEAEALIRGQITRGFSAPPPTWVHDPVFGNPDLNPEIGVSYQLGGEAQIFPFLTLELNFFKADIQDLIQFIWDYGSDDNDGWDDGPYNGRFINIGKVTKTGVEGSLRAAFDLGLTISIGGSFVDVKNGYTDEVIPNIPRSIYHIMASYENRWLNSAIYGKYIHHNSTDPMTRDRVFVFDYFFKIKFPLPEQHGAPCIYGAVYNLTDASYLYHEYWPQPGRRLEGGVRFVF